MILFSDIAKKSDFLEKYSFTHCTQLFYSVNRNKNLFGSAAKLRECTCNVQRHRSHSTSHTKTPQFLSHCNLPIKIRQSFTESLNCVQGKRLNSAKRGVRWCLNSQGGVRLSYLDLICTFFQGGIFPFVQF